MTQNRESGVWKFFNWRWWMGDDKTMLKVQVEKDLRSKVEEAAQREGLTMSAWVRKVMIHALPPPESAALSAGKIAMEAAFDALDAKSGESDFPQVMPLPPHVEAALALQSPSPLGRQAPTPAPVAQTTPAQSSAPAPTAQPTAPATAASGVKQPPAAEQHSCYHHANASGPTSNFNRSDVQGVCSAQGNRVCHWPSNAARECPMYRGRKARAAPMLPLR